MFMTAVAWLVGSKIGRWIAIGAIAGFGVLVMVYALERRGVKKEQARQFARGLKAMRQRIAIDENVRKMPIDDVRRELAGWMRHD